MKYEPNMIGHASFANGAHFLLTQVNAKGAVRITDERSGDESYASSIPAAWRSVRYQAQVRQDTQRTDSRRNDRGIWRE